MKIKIIIAKFIRIVTRRVAGRLHLASRRRATALPPHEQLALQLDQITEPGLPLRQALPVRSAEYWLQLGQPDIALQELETLPEAVRQHPWPLRVHRAALHATNH
jgi:hypothetical protein